MDGARGIDDSVDPATVDSGGRSALGQPAGGSDPHGLSAGSGPISLVAGESVAIPLSGTMSDGSPADAAVLAGVSWTSSSPAVATTEGTTLTAVGPGTATLDGQTGTGTASLAVTVVAQGAGSPPAGVPPAPPTHAIAPTKAPTTALPPTTSAPPPSASPSPAPSPPPAPQPSPSPVTTRQVVYQLYRSANYDWFYTLSATERVSAIKSDGYKSEGTDGIAFYGCRGSNYFDLKK